MDSVLCPKCGKSNDEFRSRCSECGAALPYASQALSANRPANEQDPEDGAEAERGLNVTEKLGAPETDTLVGQSISHYQVLRRLGAGGMGVVYRATDTALRRTVALKFLSPKLSQSPLAKARLMREAHAASVLDDSNIGTVYEVGEHDGQLFIAMAFYEGQTLQERLQRGPLSVPEAESILSQLASALSTAHRAGIVHRDLKPANVMLMERRAGSGERRASGMEPQLPPHGAPLVKLLDFGLAKLQAEGDEAERSLTQAGAMLGTVAYMSPEQARGAAVDHRTDLWSLGVVAYELLAGTSPYQADSKAATLGRILYEEPRPLRELRDEVPPALEELVRSLLSKEPGQRPQSAEEVLQALERKLRQRQRLAPAAASRTGRSGLLSRLPVRLMLLLLATVGIVAAGLVFNRGASLFDAHRVSAPAPRRSVAVLGFKNLSGLADMAWLSTALAEMLTTELAAGEKLRTVPGETVARMRSDLSLAEAESYSEETLARIHKNLGTDFVVLGSYLVAGNGADRQMRLDLRVQDAVGGETLTSMSEEGTEAQVLQIVARAGSRLRATLGVGELSAEQASELGATRPSGPEAARLYAEALAKSRVYDHEAARQLLEHSVAVDPGYSLAHSALAEALGALGRDADARQEAMKAFELSAKLSREDRLLIEGRYWESQRQWDKAIEIYRSLFTFFPDDVDHGLRLALAEGKAGQVKTARATIERLRELPAPANDDARIDLQEAWIDLTLSDCEEARIAAARGVTNARKQGALLLSAKARRAEGLAWNCLGETDKATAILEEVKGDFIAAGDRRTAATTAFFLGDTLAAHGDFARARRTLEESLAACRDLGFTAGISQALNSIAWVAHKQGDLAEARKIYEQLLASDEQDKAHVAAVASHQTGLALVLQAQGHLAEARLLHEESLRGLRESDFKNESNASLVGLGDLLAAEGDLTGARKYHEEALALAKEAVQNDAVALTQFAMARLALDEAKPAEAEALAVEALQQFQKQKISNLEWRARGVLARSLVAQGRLTEAKERIAGAQDWAQKSENLEARLEVLLANARVRSASGKPEDVGAAVRSLEAAAQEATQAGFVELQLEARLELGRLELTSGKVEEGRALLGALTAEAEAKGFKLIARQAKSER